MCLKDTHDKSTLRASFCLHFGPAGLLQERFKTAAVPLQARLTQANKPVIPNSYHWFLVGLWAGTSHSLRFIVFYLYLQDLLRYSTITLFRNNLYLSMTLLVTVLPSCNVYCSYVYGLHHRCTILHMELQHLAPGPSL